MTEKETDEFASKSGCIITLTLIFVGIVSLFTDFWYIFIGILVLIIILYKKKK